MLDDFKTLAAKIAKEASVQFYEGSVITAPPNLSIRLRGNSNLTIPKSLITVAAHLKTHKHQVVIPAVKVDTNSAGSHSHGVSGTANDAGGHSHSITGNIGEAEGHSHSFSGNANSAGSHSHTLSGSANSAGAHAHSVTIPERTLDTSIQDDSLKIGDHIMVAVVQGGQSFFVMDRITR